MRICFFSVWSIFSNNSYKVVLLIIMFSSHILFAILFTKEAMDLREMKIRLKVNKTKTIRREKYEDY